MEEATQAKSKIVSDTDFVIFWQQADSAQEVADHFDLKRSSVIQRACGLRNKTPPVLLKKFPRVNNGRQARGEEYYSSLANLAAEHGDLCDAPETDDESESNDDN